MFRFLIPVFAIAMSAVAQPPVPDFTPPTPLFAAVLGNNESEVKRLLDSGANPNEARFIGAPALIAALMQQNPATAKLLIEKGADINEPDGFGSTALMWAAADEAADTTILKELLKRGANPNAVNKRNESALTWALRRGYTPVVELLKQQGASDQAIVRGSVDRALGLLEKSGPEFLKVSGCTSCHNQSLPQIAVAAARQHGYRPDPQLWDKQSKATIAMFKPLREEIMQGKRSFPDPAISVSYLLIGLAASGYASDSTTEAMAYLVSKQQLPDGSFTYLAARPPMESSAFSSTALSAKALQSYGKDSETQIAKAREWLRSAKPRTSEERVMKLLGLLWTKADENDVRSAAQSVLDEQRQDGGWSQLAALESDAYATGQSLYALLEAGAITTADKAYARGAAFLLRTQRTDGSWLVVTRSMPFQPIKESGFPHGKDQWISATGTSWAVLALTASLPVEQQLSQVVE